MGLTACRSVPLCLLLYPFRRVCQGGGRPKPPSAREVAARSAGGGRDVTRFFLSPSRLRRQPPHRGGLAARQRCHSEPVTRSLARESGLSFVGKRIAAPVCGLARNDKVCRGGRLCPPLRRIDKNRQTAYNIRQGRCIHSQAVGHLLEGRWDSMFFVFTIHILGHSISIRVQRLKSKNRHPGR